MTEVHATVIVALFALISSVAGAFINYKAQRTANETKKQAETDRELAAARQKIDDQERIAAREKLDGQINALSEMMQSNFKTMKKDMEKMHVEIDSVKASVRSLEEKTDKRLANQEERMRAIVDVLSKNTRTFSAMMKMHAQADSRMGTLMEVSSYNLKFAKETANALQVVGEVLCEVAEDHANVSETDMTRLNGTIGTNTVAQQQFMDKIIAAQMAFFNQPSFGPDPTTDREIAEIRAILNLEDKGGAKDAPHQE